MYGRSHVLVGAGDPATKHPKMTQHGSSLTQSSVGINYRIWNSECSENHLCCTDRVNFSVLTQTVNCANKPSIRSSNCQLATVWFGRPSLSTERNRDQALEIVSIPYAPGSALGIVQSRRFNSGVYVSHSPMQRSCVMPALPAGQWKLSKMRRSLRLLDGLYQSQERIFYSPLLLCNVPTVQFMATPYQ